MKPQPQSAPTLTKTRALPIVNDTGSTRLAAELARHVQGEVRFDEGTRALYATGASNYRQIPIGVVVPRDLDDVLTTLRICRRFDAPVLSRGGGTSLAGQITNTAVVIEFSKYLHGIVELDHEAGFAVVQPGLVLDDLRQRAEQFHLTFGPDPATHNRCTLGGMIGNNSCGVHSVMAGCTAENVLELDVVTYDGARFTVGPTSESELARIVHEGGRRAEIYRQCWELRDRYADAIRSGFPNIPRRVSGYNLPALLPEHGSNLARALVGSEGTLVTVLRAKVRLVPSPKCRVLVVLGYPSIDEAADHVLDVMESQPIGLEGMDSVLVEGIKKKSLGLRGLDFLPKGGGWLLVELGADSHEVAHEKACALAARLGHSKNPPHVRIVEDPEEEHIVWQVRESGLGATARVPGEHDTWEGWEDAAVPPEKLGAYLREFRALLDRYGFHAALYGHFGQGCVHTRIPFDLRSKPGVAQFRSFVEEAADLVVRHGGSLSGEHGDGQSRAELLPRMFRPELIRAFEEFKAIWDPHDRMNPGKIVRPYRLDENLRLGADYSPAEWRTHFRFPEDEGSFSYATERCVGVGECRRLNGGTMCPSYMVTREEAHSTRGRAHLLFEAMRGGLSDGARSEAVHEALDLCLACKGCKTDCPVNVDLATYKAEFLAHYYEGRLRPRSAYAFGWVYWWARLASLVPRLANFVMHAPGLSRLMKAATGIAPERDFPPFARVTFKAWWRSHARRNEHGPTVLLWADTFNNHWQPEVLIAAVRVLEQAGYHVLVPEESLCCGRPLYDYGMLETAKDLLQEILESLRPAIRAGIPVVGVEPSCVAVFRDELVNFFPDDEGARALKERSFMLDEFLSRDDCPWQPPRLERKAMVHGHCHQKAIMQLGSQAAVMKKLGLDAEVLESGCCGMAGGFGYEKDHYAVSIACGERKLLPAVRDAGRDVIVIADGFSCREQIRQQTDRQGLHLAQVLQMAIEQGPSGPSEPLPERRYVQANLTKKHAPTVALLVGAVVALTVVLGWLLSGGAQPVVIAP